MVEREPSPAPPEARPAPAGEGTAPADVEGVLEQEIPAVLHRLLREVLGDTIPRGPGDKYRIACTGAFSNRVASDVLAMAENQLLDGALVFVDRDVRRTLWFRHGRVVGAGSDLIFERLGRVLLRGGLVDSEEARRLVRLEAAEGAAAALGSLSHDAARWALERRAWEIATALFFMTGGHFVMIHGTPDLGGVGLLDLRPADLALEGMRRYDEWRHGKSGAELPPRDGAA